MLPVHIAQIKKKQESEVMEWVIRATRNAKPGSELKNFHEENVLLGHGWLSFILATQVLAHIGSGDMYDV